ncbi:hypothetical protein WCWAEYFT_CDS0232 [Vibrio phage VB_VaC_TDDLMA]
MDYTKIKIKDIPIGSCIMYQLAYSNTYIAQVKDYTNDENGEYFHIDDLISIEKNGWLSDDLAIPQSYIDSGRLKILHMEKDIKSFQEKYPEHFI